jgi:rsbT co-antagonist protein RsbR
LDESASKPLACRNTQSSEDVEFQPPAPHHGRKLDHGGPDHLFLEGATVNVLTSIFDKHKDNLTRDWSRELVLTTRREDLMSEKEFQGQMGRFVQLLRSAVAQSGDSMDISKPQFGEVKEFLAEISRTRAQQGFTPTETALFVLSMKKPIFTALRAEYKDPQMFADHSWAAGEVLDRLALYTTEIHQKTREELIARQQQDMLELSTPVVKLWEGILALPLIGTLDSQRTAVVMESLLQKIVDTGSGVAIIDITGVPMVDTLVAQHLLKTVTAARLMGADCIISGIRPQIAQTIVHLGVELGDVITKSSLADAFHIALKRRGLAIQKANGDDKQKDKTKSHPATQGSSE